MANHFSILALRTPMNSMKRQNDRILKEEIPRSVGAQYATREEWRNNSRNKEETESKQKQNKTKQTNKQTNKHPVVDVTRDGSKAQCCKEQYYTYYCGQESLRRNGVAIMVNKRV